MRTMFKEMNTLYIVLFIFLVCVTLSHQIHHHSTSTTPKNSAALHNGTAAAAVNATTQSITTKGTTKSKTANNTTTAITTKRSTTTKPNNRVFSYMPLFLPLAAIGAGSMYGRFGHYGYHTIPNYHLYYPPSPHYHPYPAPVPSYKNQVYSRPSAHPSPSYYGHTLKLASGYYQSHPYHTADASMAIHYIGVTAHQHHKLDVTKRFRPTPHHTHILGAAMRPHYEAMELDLATESNLGGGSTASTKAASTKRNTRKGKKKKKQKKRGGKKKG